MPRCCVGIVAGLASAGRRGGKGKAVGALLLATGALWVPALLTVGGSPSAAQVPDAAGDTDGRDPRDALDLSSRGGLAGADPAPNGPSYEPAISSSGRYVAIRSAASNLVGSDTNAVDDIFVFDFVSVTTRRVSVSSTGAEADNASSDPAISADGRYVAFRSDASNLVGGDSNGVADVFVRDRAAKTTTRVSVDGAGAQANGASAEPSLSADGRYVAFRSAASNLVGSDTNAADDIFVRDRTAGTTTRVSVGAAGLQANGASGAPAVSGNGGFVAFHSSASNLVGGDTNSATDVFVRSLAGATTTRVSLSAGGGQGSDPSSSPSISSDGTRIAFQSTAALASGDDNGVSDVYVRDRSANTTTWAAAWAQAQGWTSRGANSSPSISGDGRYVALALDSDVAISDLNNARDIYEYDLTSGEWAHISQDTVTGPGNKASDSPSLSSDGTRAAFESLATNFHADTNGAQDTFVHQWVKSPATGGTASGTSPAEGPAQEETQPPRHCGLAKPEAPTGEPAPDSSSGVSRHSSRPDRRRHTGVLHRNACAAPGKPTDTTMAVDSTADGRGRGDRVRISLCSVG